MPAVDDDTIASSSFPHDEKPISKAGPLEFDELLEQELAKGSARVQAQPSRRDSGASKGSFLRRGGCTRFPLPVPRMLTSRLSPHLPHILIPISRSGIRFIWVRADVSASNISCTPGHGRRDRLGARQGRGRKAPQPQRVRTRALFRGHRQSGRRCRGRPPIHRCAASHPPLRSQGRGNDGNVPSLRFLFPPWCPRRGRERVLPRAQRHQHLQQALERPREGYGPAPAPAAQRVGRGAGRGRSAAETWGGRDRSVCPSSRGQADAPAAAAVGPSVPPTGGTQAPNRMRQH